MALSFLEELLGVALLLCNDYNSAAILALPFVYHQNEYRK